MSDGITATIDTRAAVKALNRLGKRAQDPRPAFGQFHAAYNLKVAFDWNRTKINTAHTFRGEEEWPALREQYIRADGTVVPVWGGTAKASGKGKVKAKLKGRKTAKGGGKRYSANDIQMVFSTRLRSWWLTRKHNFQGKTVLVIGAEDNAPKYAAYQNSLRRFAFFKTPDDVRLLKAHFLRWVRKELTAKFSNG